MAATSTKQRAEPSRPELSPGIELLGELEGSGFKQPQYFARDQQGQVIQLPQWLFLVASQIDGQRTTEEIAGRISRELGRRFTPEDVDYLIESQLRPLGVVPAKDGSQATAAADPLLGLKLKTAVVPPRAVHALTTVFAHFFHPPVVLAALAAFVGADVWFFGFHGVAQPARELVYNPILLVMVFALVVVATALHEIGHASAARYGGAKPGAMGVGIYIVWPAFYTDITDSYRLGRGGRLRTDLGGIYFNVLFTLAIVGAYGMSRFEPLLVLVVIQHVQIVQQLLPFLRLDGYYILADLTGVPDMFSRIKPTLKSALPWRDGEPRADELKPWVRVVTTAWVVFLIPVLVFMFGSIIINLSRMAATAWDSLQLQVDRVAGGDGFEIAAGLIQASALVLPITGITYTLTRASMRIGSASWRWSEHAPLRRGLVIAMGAAIAAVAGYVLYPNGDYRAIQPGERGTLVGAIEQFAALPSGRPGLTEERARELGLEASARTPNPAPRTPTGRATRPGSRPATPERSPAPRPGTQTAGGAGNSQPPPGGVGGQTVTTPALPQPGATVSTPLVTTSATLPTPPPVTVTTPPAPVPAPTVPLPTTTLPVEPLPGVPVP